MKTNKFDNITNTVNALWNIVWSNLNINSVDFIIVTKNLHDFLAHSVEDVMVDGVMQELHDDL